jgi:hypothetical protein
MSPCRWVVIVSGVFYGCGVVCALLFAKEKWSFPKFFRGPLWPSPTGGPHKMTTSSADQRWWALMTPASNEHQLWQVLLAPASSENQHSPSIAPGKHLC